MVESITNAEMLRRVIDSMFHVVSKNTTPAFAWLTLRIMLQKNCYTHQFLYNVDIGAIESVQQLNPQDPTFTKTTIAEVPEEINSMNAGQIGQCILDIIQELRNQMGKQAGYILLHQFRLDIGEKYYNLLQEYGVNLQLAELQYELYGWKADKSDEQMPNLNPFSK